MSPSSSHIMFALSCIQRISPLLTLILYSRTYDLSVFKALMKVSLAPGMSSSTTKSDHFILPELNSFML